MARTPHYIGRFAPSPSGPLHLGSLVAALASYLDARAHHGRWLLRMEDIDPPREVAGARHAILDGLQRHDLHWDGAVLYQSQRSDAYDAALAQLQRAGRLFHCTCSRAELAASGGIHPDACLQRRTPPAQPHALRLLPAAEAAAFEDRIQGPVTAPPGGTGNDLVLRRRDGLYAYALAVVVDDAAQGVSDVVRGADLLDATPGQLALQRALGLPHPRYAHVPVIVGADGRKLSKQNHAPALDPAHACDNLRLALRFLGQPEAAGDTAGAILRSAVGNWQPQRIARRLTLPLPGL